ncbi:hypothetical protein MMC13_001350 [Lambiella insularis]|nr:hypothetical protein [Lambiella insularis]
MATTTPVIWAITPTVLSPHYAIQLGTEEDPIRHSILTGTNGPEFIAGCVPGARAILYAYSTCILLEALCENVRLLPSEPMTDKQQHWSQGVTVFKSTAGVRSRIQLRSRELFCIDDATYCLEYQPILTRPPTVVDMESKSDSASNAGLEASEIIERTMTPAISAASDSGSYNLNQHFTGASTPRASEHVDNVSVAAECSQEGAVPPVYHAPTFYAQTQTPPSRTTTVLDAIPSSNVKIKKEEDAGGGGGENVMTRGLTTLDSIEPSVQQTAANTRQDHRNSLILAGTQGVSGTSRNIEEGSVSLIQRSTDTPCPVRHQAASTNVSDLDDSRLGPSAKVVPTMEGKQLEHGVQESDEQVSEEDAPKIQSFIRKLQPTEEANDTQESTRMRGVRVTDAALELNLRSSNPPNEEVPQDDQGNETQCSSTAANVSAAENLLQSATFPEGITDMADIVVQDADDEEALEKEEPVAKRQKRLSNPSRKILERERPNTTTAADKVLNAHPSTSTGILNKSLESVSTPPSQPSQQTDGSTIKVKSTRKRPHLLREAKSTPSIERNNSISSQNDVSRSIRSSAKSASRAPDAGPTVLFGSTTTINDASAVMKRFLKAGARQTSDVHACDYMCIGPGPVKVTSNLVKAVTSGKHVVTEDWVRQSAAENELLDPTDFLADDPELESRMGLTLAEAVERGRTQPKPLDGFMVYFTPATKKELGKAAVEYKDIAMHGGAVVESRAPKSSDDRSQWLIISSTNDAGLSKLLESGLTSYTKDIITMSVLRSVLDLESEEFVIGAQSAGRGSTAKSRGTKRKR